MSCYRPLEAAGLFVLKGDIASPVVLYYGMLSDKTKKELLKKEFQFRVLEMWCSDSTQFNPGHGKR
jgi:hypothetical protein